MLVAVFSVVLVNHVVQAQPKSPDLATKAQAILKTHCYRCHGQDGVFEGGMNFVLDPAKLIARKKIVPGKPTESPLFLRIEKGTMPPVGEEPRVSATDREILKEWIATGAAPTSPVVAHSAIDSAAVSRWILADLDKFERRSRRFLRYFSLVPLYNQGLSDDELQTYRNALSKLINSLSWHPNISVPQPIDANKTVLRIDLRSYMWDSTIWNRLLVEYPFDLLDDSASARAIAVGTATKVPLVRADWFVATACRPPLYYELLQMPNNLPELERQLRVDAVVNIQQERVVRLGFNGSGISKNNRILERHDALHGAYWRTYDFDAVPQNLIERGQLLPDRRNIFAYPLGPFTQGGSDPFQHAGGEAIFSLPNGLHGFMLVNAAGIRIDKGPIAIVSDPKRPDRAVEPGVSCMSCHLTGINPKTDQVRDFVAKNPNAFKRTDAEVIRALYAPDERSKKLMDEDIEKYRKAVEATGAKIKKTEPVSTLTLRYEGDLDLNAAAAEAGFTADEFRQKIQASEVLTKNLGALRVAGGTIARQVFVQAYGDIVRDLRLGTLFANNTSGGALPDNTGDLDPLESRGGKLNHAVFSRDGKFALLADADRSVRYFDVQGGRDVRRFVGHVASVWCVAFSPDEKRALSGSMDGSVRLWNVATGQELKKLDGHLSLVSTVAFSPDGKYALSGGYDGAVVYWDLDTGRETRRFDGLGKYVHSLTFLPNGKWAAVATDYETKRIGLESGAIETLPGNGSVVTCVAVSPDGNAIVVGNERGEMRFWEKKGTAWIVDAKLLSAHSGSLKDIAFAPSGKALLTAGADQLVKLWDLGTRTAVGKFDKHADAIVAARFIDGGQQTLSASRDGAVKYWPLKKFEALVVAVDKEPDVVIPGAKPQAALTPLTTVPIGGTIGNMVLSPNRRWLFLLNRTSGELLQIDTTTMKVTRTLDLPDSDVFTLTQDGKTLATFVPDGARTWVVLIDPVPLTVRTRFRIDSKPYDIAASNSGLLFLSGDGGGWTDIAVVDTNKQTIAGRWGGFWNRSLVLLAADQSRVYVASQGVNPGKLEGLPIPAKLDEKPTAYSARAQDFPAGGAFTITPDGQFILQQSGSAIRIASNRDEDLRDGVKVAPHMSTAVDAEKGQMFLLSTDGFTVKQYAYPDLKWQRDLRLAVPATQIAFDGKTNRLYAAVFDPQSAATKPRARGHGDVHVFDLSVGRTK
jgi:WD40 repeat protein/mono/diheme cytochrome c family protein